MVGTMKSENVNVTDYFDFFAKNSSSAVLDFADIHKGRDKIFAWGLGFPGHLPMHNTELQQDKEKLERFIINYYASIEQMEKEVKHILSLDPNAIIVLMSDHGTWALSWNIYSVLEDKRFYNDKEISQRMIFRDIFGAFMAIRWPDKERAAKYDKEFNVTQDLFPIVFAYLYDSPVPLKYKIKQNSAKIKGCRFDGKNVICNAYEFKCNNDFW
jgi:arylsulfatase A-like enzyme